MSHIMYVGGVGMGKTALAVLACQLDVGDFVYSNIPLDQKFFPRPDIKHGPSKKQKFKNIVQWEALEEVEDAHCGVWLMDEADMWLDSRKFSTLNDVARRKLKEHRKDDIRIISTTQHVSFVDRVFRILCDEVRVVEKHSWPFLGWIFPSCVRPDMNCAHCRRMRPDGLGDRHYWWQRWFGFGTIYTWDIYPASVLGADESAGAKDTRRKEEESADGEGEVKSKRTGQGWKLFNMSFAQAYNTVHKASQTAASAIAHKEDREAEAKALKVAEREKRRAETLALHEKWRQEKQAEREARRAEKKGVPTPHQLDNQTYMDDFKAHGGEIHDVINDAIQVYPQGPL